MPRASNGVYSLPAGNPVVTGTTISSTWANTTLSDLATAMTDSLDRSGFGGMLASLGLFAGSKSTPGLSWTTETNSGLYRNAAGDFRYSIAANDVFQITTAGITMLGSATLNSPSFIGTSVFSVGGSSSNAAIQAKSTLPAFALINTGGATDAKTWEIVATTTDFFLRTSNDAGTTTKTIIDVTRAANVTSAITIGDATDRPVITLNGRTVVASPASGTALSVTAISGQAGLSVTGGANSYAAVINGSGTTSQSFGQLIRGGTNASDAALVVQNSAASATFFQVIGTGQTTVFAPSIGDALTVSAVSGARGIVVNGAASAYALGVGAPTTSNVSFGARINGGTSSSDICALFQSASAGTTYFQIRGDGLTSAVDQGGSLWDVGWRDCPSNSNGGNYTTVLQDRGKMIVMVSSGATLTIAANASVAYPLGTVLVIANNSAGSQTISSSDTLVLAGTGTSGSRTLASNGVATALKVGTTTWFVSGSGLS